MKDIDGGAPAGSANGQALPDFSDPPVAEVALSVQFEPLSAFRAAHIGLFWSQLREKFPKTQEQIPIAPVVERFGGRTPVQPMVQFFSGGVLPRIWFLNSDETELVQLQTDRLIYNWRKQRGTAPYPRYRNLREKLQQELARLATFVEEEKIGVLVPTQCELTYINHIVPNPLVGDPPDASKIIVSWHQQYSDSFLPTPESVNAAFTFLMPSSGTMPPSARLYVTLAPGLRVSDNSAVLTMQVVCRGAPDGQGAEGVFRFLDKAHEWSVRGFVSITSPTMHQHWGRTR